MTWYLAQTKVSQEQRAFAHLTNQGFETYLPRCQTKIRGRLVSTPLFRRYIFLRPRKVSHDLSTIRSTRGVQGLVYFGDEAARVPEEVIKELQQRESGSGFVSIRLPIEPGDRVRVIKGPLDQLEGVFECEDSKGRATILVNMLLQVIPAKINMNWLERV